MRTVQLEPIADWKTAVLALRSAIDYITGSGTDYADEIIRITAKGAPRCADLQCRRPLPLRLAMRGAKTCDSRCRTRNARARRRGLRR